MARVLSLVLVALLVCQHSASAVTDEKCQVDSMSQSCTVDEHSLLQQKLMRDGTGRVGLHDAIQIFCCPANLHKGICDYDCASSTSYWLTQYVMDPRSCSIWSHPCPEDQVCAEGVGCVSTTTTTTTPLLLRNAKFLMTHDSATGYIGQSDINPNHVDAKTQRTGLVGQLKCGARALDLRLTVEGVGVVGTTEVKYKHYSKSWLGWHGWESDQTVPQTLPSVIQWAQQHPDELVLLIMSRCAITHRDNLGDISNFESVDCADDRILAPFKEQGVPIWSSGVNQQFLTLEEAKQQALLTHGGPARVLGIVATYNVYPNYFPTIQLSDLEQCDSPKSVQWNNLWTYIQQHRTTTSNLMHQTQALWQYESIWNSPLKTTEESDINQHVLDKIQKTGSSGVNLLEVNDVCSQGVAIARALGTTVDQQDEEACRAECEAGGYPGWQPACK